ncbi:hypothetical protein [Acinetobacter sp. ABJ-A23_2]|uniref:hypothetical protein n=1 Tax=Acinetobacter sp. ABJ-A23_2 TaxID=3376991 RepID=UPI0037CB66E6
MFEIQPTFGEEIKNYIIQVESIDELLNLEKWDGRSVYVKSYHVGLNKGGGTFIYDTACANQNDGGLILNGWVRAWDTYITPEMFGCKGNGIDDDYANLIKCFTALSPVPELIYDANFEQHKAKSGTLMLSSVVYRHTKPLRLPAMMDVLSSGAMNYFLEPDIITNNNHPCFYYDGADLEVAAVYLPLYLNNGNGTWSLNNNSTYIANIGDAAERSMSVNTKFRFNVITRRNTKIGVNLYGHEGGEAELGVGTMGTWASDQTVATDMQSQDYNYDDLSPRCGIYVRRAWNGKLTRPRVIAHKTGIFLGRHSAGYIVDQAYVNRQLDKHIDALGLQSEFIADGIPPAKNVTCGIVIDEFNGTLNNPITEHWGVAYMIASSGITLNKPHIEGSNLIMNNNFIVYNSKINVNDWSGIRSMYGRNGTSIVYSNGMNKAQGDYFKLNGAGYYADNSEFIIVDGSGYDANYNYAFLSIENIPHDKLIGACWFSDSRYIKKISGIPDNFYTIYVNPLVVNNGFGVGQTSAINSLNKLDETIRLLDKAWNGVVELVVSIQETSKVIINSNIKISFNMNGKILETMAGIAFNGNVDVSFYGAGILKATGTNLFLNESYLKRHQSFSFFDGIAFQTDHYILQNISSSFLDLNVNINNSDLSLSVGKYVNVGDALGSVDLFVKSLTRNILYDSSPVDNATNSLVRSKFLN